MMKTNRVLAGRARRLTLLVAFLLVFSPLAGLFERVYSPIARADPQSVIFDSASSNAAFGPMGVLTLSWMHTVGSGMDRLLIVGVSSSIFDFPIPAPRVGLVTFGGIPLMPLGPPSLSPDFSSAVEMFQLVNPPSITAPVMVVMAIPVINFVVGGSASFEGVNQTTPTGPFTPASGPAGPPPFVSVPSAPGEIVIDTVASIDVAGFMDPDPSQTEQWNGASIFKESSVGGGSTQPGAAPIVFMSWSQTNPIPWAIGAVAVKPQAPTEVRLNSFNASTVDEGVALEWQTGYEVDNLGFNIYREENGQRIRINRGLIAGSALFAGAKTELTAGRTYSWRDRGAQAGGHTSYWLEEIDLDGTSILHGPVGASGKAAGKPPAAQSALLADISADAAQENTSGPLARKAHPIRPTAALLAAQDNLASRPAAKITVRQEGWYRIAQPDLLAAGIDPNTDPRMLQVFVDGKQLPISVTGEIDGRFDPSDAIEFYALGLDSPYSDARAYWISARSQPGLRIRRAQAEPSGASEPSFPYTVERRDRTIYFSSLRNGERENFFGSLVSKSSLDQSLTLRHIDQAASEATLELALQGVTIADHRIRVKLNGADAGEVSFHGQSQGLARIALDKSLLREGQNIVSLTAEGGDRDVSLVDYIRITYGRGYTAEGNLLRFSAAGRQQVTIDGFTNDGIRVFDITDPDSVQEVAGSVSGQGAGNTVTLTAPGAGPRTLLALAADQIRRPTSIAANRVSSLRQKKNKADLVIITHQDFLGSVKPLRNLRRSQGLAVAIVDVEDIYDEFSLGQKTPQAVKDFLAFARSSWKRAPRFVLLAGDASYDPKSYLGLGDSDLVPTKLIDTNYMETASDDWLADFDHDGVADLAIGRLPVRTDEEASLLVSKIIDYESSSPVQEVLLAADANDGFDFEASNNALASLIPPSLRVTQVNRGRVDIETAKKNLLDGIHRGQKLVNYTGHGSVNLWRGNLLTNADAADLTNKNLPVFVMMTCLNGYFHDAALDSLAESLLKAERGGAIAVWASSGMTMLHEQAMMNKQFYRLIFSGDPSLTLGEAARRAKSSVSSRDVRRTWVLLGDPAMTLK